MSFIVVPLFIGSAIIVGGFIFSPYIPSAASFLMPTILTFSAYINFS
jgi:hypothetical protein